MNRTILKITIIFFLIFCFVVFFIGLKKPNNYIPDKNIGKKILYFSSKQLFNNETINSDELFNENWRRFKNHFWAFNIPITGVAIILVRHSFFIILTIIL